MLTTILRGVTYTGSYTYSPLQINLNITFEHIFLKYYTFSNTDYSYIFKYNHKCTINLDIELRFSLIIY